MKSGSLLTKNPLCLYPGELHGSPTTALGDDELSRHCRVIKGVITLLMLHSIKRKERCPFFVNFQRNTIASDEKKRIKIQ